MNFSVHDRVILAPGELGTVIETTGHGLSQELLVKLDDSSATQIRLASTVTPLVSDGQVIIFGQPYPVLKTLAPDWFLIAHPNGPAVASNHGRPRGGTLAILTRCQPELPQSVQWQAIDAYIELTWPAYAAAHQLP